MPKYYTSPTTAVTPAELASSLRLLLAQADRYFAAVDPATAHQPLASGKWSIAQTVGHLIDSAQNNLQRIVRLQYVDSLDLPGYQQDDWIRIQRYDLVPFEELRLLWLALNSHLAHTIEHADPTCFAHTWRFEGDDITLAFIIEDYVAHMRHHLEQLPGFGK